MATFKLRPKAVADLRAIRLWIAKDDPRRARSFVIELTEHFQRLADRHIRHRRMPELGPDLLCAVHGNYNIYYRFVGDGAQDVLVVRVLHSARDLSGIEIN